MGNSIQKKNRVLDIFYRAMKGENISVGKIANEYEVSTKSISRDINEIKHRCTRGTNKIKKKC